MPATTKYERFLFTFSVVLWLVFNAALTVLAILLFPGYRLAASASTNDISSLLERLTLPFAIVTLAGILMNFVTQNLKPVTVLAMALTFLILPLHCYLAALPDILLAPNITPALTFFLSTYSGIAVLSDKIGFTNADRSIILKRAFFIFSLIISAVLAFFLILACFSGHVIAQTLSLLYLTFPFTFFLTLLLAADSTIRLLDPPARFLIRILSTILPFYSILRILIPDLANKITVILLPSLLFLIVFFWIGRKLIHIIKKI